LPLQLIKENKLTVKECAEKLNLTVHAIYKMIKEERGVGKHFKYKAGAGWNVDARRVKAVKK